MGRKIPARKHHGIRDPIKQNALKYEKIKNIINNPPQKVDDQKVSYKLAKFIKLKDDFKKKKVIKFKKSRHHGVEDLPPKKHRKRLTKKFPPIKQLPNESNKKYLYRVHQITQEALKEAQYEAKYNVDVVRDSGTGEIEIKKRPKNELDEIISKYKNGKKKKSEEPKKKIPAKMIRDALKELDEQEKKEKHIDEYKRDEVKFGEVVHAPPSLTTLPRKAKQNDPVPRPGKKNNLLLQNLLNPKINDQSKNLKNKKLEVDLRGKRKNLPSAMREKLENQQTQAIELYRAMKKNNKKTFS